jgi:hypothetical protein
MIRFIHQERRFEKELEDLWQRGEQGAAAAQKAEELVKALTLNGPPDLRKVWKLTGWGEKRVEGCLKYDLGEGFRVVSFRRGETLFLSFVGDHDECQKYLDHYSGRHNWVAKENGTTLPIEMAEQADGQEAVSADDFEEDYDDKTLRKIFCGLAKNGKHANQAV